MSLFLKEKERIDLFLLSCWQFGLAYAGVGWAFWRDKSYIPDEVIFTVNCGRFLFPSLTSVTRLRTDAERLGRPWRSSGIVHAQLQQVRRPGVLPLRCPDSEYHADILTRPGRRPVVRSLWGRTNFRVT